MPKSYPKPALVFPLMLVFYEIVTYLSNDMYLPSLPALAQDFKISQDVSQYTLSLWFLGSACLQLVMGPLSDRYGRRIVLITGGIFFILASFMCAVTHDINLMLLGRFIQGSTVCSVVVAGYSAIHESYDSKTAIKIISLMGSITILAPALGPLLGAIVLEFSGWRFIFYLLGIGSLISVGLLFKVMPETNSKRIKLHLKNILQDYLNIATRRAFLSYVLPFCFLFSAFICWIVESPFMIIETYHKTPFDYGLIQFLVFGSFMVGAQATRILIHKKETVKIIRFGLRVACGAAVALLIAVFLGEAELYCIVGAMMLMALGASMTFGPLNRCAIESCQEPMGRCVAIFSSFMGLAGVLATFIVTLFNNETVHNLSIMIASGTILAFLLYFLMQKKND